MRLREREVPGYTYRGGGGKYTDLTIYRGRYTYMPGGVHTTLIHIVGGAHTGIYMGRHATSGYIGRS